MQGINCLNQLAARGVNRCRNCDRRIRRRDSSARAFILQSLYNIIRALKVLRELCESIIGCRFRIHTFFNVNSNDIVIAALLACGTIYIARS